MKQNQQEIIHPCFGRIRLSDKIAKVLALPDFRDLAEKSQLGDWLLESDRQKMTVLTI